MKIGFFGLKDKEKEEYYKNALSNHELTFIDECLKEDSLPQKTDFDIISIFVCCKLTPKVIDTFPNLRFIAIRSTGFDNVDLEHAKSKNILVSNVPAYGSHTVAEFAFALILSLSRRVPEAIHRVRVEGKFDYTNLRGFDLNEKTLGVIGTGKIGANVIKIANGFNLKILAYDAFPNQELEKEFGFRYITLDELLQGSDIITIHAPYNKDTHHLINQSNITQVKRGSYLINTARGALVETTALINALKSGQLAGAGIDVLEEEDILKKELDTPLSTDESTQVSLDHELMKMPNVIVSPHMAFFTKEAEDNIMQTTSDNIKSFLVGATKNLVK